MRYAASGPRLALFMMRRSRIWCGSAPAGLPKFCFAPPMSMILHHFIAARPADLRISVIGVGSNLLVRDGGIPGVVVRLSSAFGKIETDGMRVRAGAAALDGAVARAAADAGIAGLEFLRGVPGTIGGALQDERRLLWPRGQGHLCRSQRDRRKRQRNQAFRADMGFEYRKARGAGEDLIFVEAVFEGARDEPAAIRARMDELSANREASQPIKSKTGGSTFKNPPGHKAWQLIDRGRLPRPDDRRRPGQREAHQFPDQYRRCDRRRPGSAGRGSPPPGEGKIRHHAGMGDQAGGRSR